jgi:hypothetical protein
MMRMPDLPIPNLINEYLLPNFVDCSLRLAGYLIFVLAPFSKTGYAVMPPIVSIAIGGSDRGDFRAYSVEILVFASSTGYMLTSSGFPL